MHRCLLSEPGETGIAVLTSRKLVGLTMKSHQRKERLSIYLIKDAKLLDEQLIKIEHTKTPIKISINSSEATLHVKDSRPKIPDWVSFLFSDQDAPDNYFLGNRSEGAVLIIRIADAAFALSFGMGYHLIDLELVERDFGLRVTLNSVDPEKLRSLDKASYEANPLNTRSQSPKDADIFDLRIDTENDMVYALTGASSEPLFGDHVTGRDALTIMPEAILTDLPKILGEALNRYNQKSPERFAWVDDVNRVRDTNDIELLDLLLNDLLAANSPGTNIWLGEPEIVDWEAQTGYSFDKRERTSIHPTLQLEQLLDYMARKNITPTSESFHAQHIYVNDTNYHPIKHWSAYRCLYAEISDKGKIYILRNGVWHVVRDDFVDRVNRELKDVEIDTITMPTYAHDDEGQYNISCAQPNSGYELLDRQNIFVGGPYDKIEFCDLIRDGHDLIHVKVYRSSATLSHLFAQGSVSAETFIKHRDFRIKLNSTLPTSIKLRDASEIPNANNYRIIYAIATTKNLPGDLPFFSKVSLKNAILNLRALGFRVALSKIAIDSDFLKTRKQKPMGKAAATRKQAAQPAAHATPTSRAPLVLGASESPSA
ncbi:sporadically distributed protein, TIGR04141 family [Burkholderia orbicola]|nr:sporadically distributed protein, TIGR04141 family [Burkholderia orbicola]